MRRLPVIIMFAVLAACGAAVSGFAQGLETGMDVSSSTVTVPAATGATTANPAGVPATALPLSGTADYTANLQSDVFGARLFSGAFARQGATQFNPEYAIAIGDKIQVRLWGAFVYDAVLIVDPQGNVFLPHVGPVAVLGVRNQELQRVMENAVAKVFRANVSCYANLASAQPVRVFVGGYVRRPGLYSGTSMDSLLHYLDQAGGIDPERGSFLDVQVKRGEQVRTSVSLYDFLLEGRMALVQLSDGDVIFVSPRRNTVKVGGLAENAYRFEFKEETTTIADVIGMAKPKASATHVRLMRNAGTVVNTEYYALAEAGGVVVRNGDEIDFSADKRLGTITVRVEGEHLGAKEFTLPSGARFGDLIKQVTFSDLSDVENLQLYRRSVRERQKVMFATALKSLETSVLTARSSTSDEAKLRKDEAELILKWIERAKSIEPSGQVVIAAKAGRDDLLLENGDVVRVPLRDGLVLINGEVLFPTATVYNTKLFVDDYIDHAGGYTQNADTSRVVIAHRDGTFGEDKGRSLFGSSPVRPGDEILVLPRIDVKAMQIVKDLSEILYQIAISAKVVLTL